MISKWLLTFEQIKLWTPNKYHIVPYGKNNHLIPNLSGLDNAQMKWN